MSLTRGAPLTLVDCRQTSHTNHNLCASLRIWIILNWREPLICLLPMGVSPIGRGGRSLPLCMSESFFFSLGPILIETYYNLVQGSILFFRPSNWCESWHRVLFRLQNKICFVSFLPFLNDMYSKEINTLYHNSDVYLQLNVTSKELNQAFLLSHSIKGKSLTLWSKVRQIPLELRRMWIYKPLHMYPSIGMCINDKQTLNSLTLILRGSHSFVCLT